MSPGLRSHLPRQEPPRRHRHPESSADQRAFLPLFFVLNDHADWPTTRPTGFTCGLIAYKRTPHHTTQTLSDVQNNQLWGRQVQGNAFFYAANNTQIQARTRQAGYAHTIEDEIQHPHSGKRQSY